MSFTASHCGVSEACHWGMALCRCWGNPPLCFVQTPTCAPSMPSESPSCPRTCSWPAASAGSVPKGRERRRWSNGVFQHHPSPWGLPGFCVDCCVDPTIPSDVAWSLLVPLLQLAAGRQWHTLVCWSSNWKHGGVQRKCQVTSFPHFWLPLPFTFSSCLGVCVWALKWGH